MPKYLTETGTIYHTISRHKLNPNVDKRNKPRHLLISVAMMVMLCHTLNSLSSGVARVIFPSSALMLNCLSRSVWRSMENLQNRYICNLFQHLHDPYVPWQTFSNPWRAIVVKSNELGNSVASSFVKQMTEQGTRNLIIIVQGAISYICNMEVANCHQFQ